MELEQPTTTDLWIPDVMTLTVYVLPCKLTNGYYVGNGMSFVLGRSAYLTKQEATAWMSGVCERQIERYSAALTRLKGLS